MRQADATLEDDSQTPDSALPTWSVGFVVLALLIWLAPFSLGIAMPVGGDSTQFFLGLMATYSSSLAEWRIPVWNDLWGYGFPGVGESQIGAFYPPHIVLYGLPRVEYAYVASLVLHTLWAGLGACWAARRFGAGRLGAGLAGFAYAASGFFVIHMPHPWGYTTGSWTPWAWGLAWSILNHRGRETAGRLCLASSPLKGEDRPRSGPMRGTTAVGRASDDRSASEAGRPPHPALRATFPHEGGRPSFKAPKPLRDSLLLAAVLTIQVLPGHFQIAFMTQATVGMMAVWMLLETRAVGRFALVLLGLAVALPMAAAQVWPTARLAGMAADQRDYEYLSGFAAAPFHLVSLVAPRLFHGSTLWRPLVWDPFHTSPEECLAYVGIVPLFLALMTIRRGRRDAAVRCLAVLAVVTLILSLGPYVPGFGWLIRLPGFSFFRAPARWGLPMSLALAILAGLGVDRWRTWERPARGLLIGSIGALVWIGIVVGLIELALYSTPAAAADRGLASLFERAFALRPWEGGDGFGAVATIARRRTADPQIPATLEQAGFRRSNGPRDVRSFEQKRFEIYRDELWTSAAILAVLAISAATPRLRSQLPVLLVVLTLVDLTALGMRRHVAIGPLKPLTKQSALLARLAREPRGTRAIDPMRNLPMAVGLAPVRAYRTLDLAVLPALAVLAAGPLRTEALRDPALQAMRATGASLRVLDPIEVAALQMQGVPPPGDAETIADPTLARWLFGDDWNPDRLAWAETFQVVKTADAPRAWLTTAPIPENLSGHPIEFLSRFDATRPLPAQALSPTEWEIDLAEVHGPGTVMLSVLYDPQWKATVIGADQTETPANIRPLFRVGQGGGGWIGLEVNESPGARAVVRLRYDAVDVRRGLWVSGSCWTAWTLAILYAMSRERRGVRRAAE